MIAKTKNQRSRRRNSATNPDAGFTLPELLITVAITGLLVAVMSAAMTVMFRATPQAEDRLSESKDITFLQAWVPVDLSSAINSYDDPDDAVVLQKLADQDPSMSYSADLPGTNVLTLVVPDLGSGSHQIIAYRYAEVNGEWQLLRLVIRNPGTASETVSTVGVAHELPGPPEDGSWTEDMVPAQRPSHAFEITSRNQASVRPIGENVTVHFKSGNTFSTGGAGLSAERNLTPNDPVTLPDPTAPPTRCGGRVALLLDTSYSVPKFFQGGGDLEAAAIGFIDSFQGTPTDVTILGFDGIAYQFYPNTGGSMGEYFSLLNPSTSITEAKAAIASLPDRDVAGQKVSYYIGDRNDPIGWTQRHLDENGNVAKDSKGGDSGTNWSDALRAPFFDLDGNQRGSTPETVIFITDGQPNRRYSDFFGNPKTNVASDQADNVTAAAAMANRGRATGARIVGVLLNAGSAADTQNMADVVGSNAWNGGVNSDGSIDIGNAVAADYFASDFSQLGAVLRTIMAAECGGTVTVQKDVAGGTASGQWNYSTATGSATLDLSVASSLTFDYVFAAGETSREVTITEEVKDGFVFDHAECRSAGALITDPAIVRPNDDGSPGVTVTVTPDQALSCTMISNPE